MAASNLAGGRRDTAIVMSRGTRGSAPEQNPVAQPSLLLFAATGTGKTWLAERLAVPYLLDGDEVVGAANGWPHTSRWWTKLSTDELVPFWDKQVRALAEISSAMVLFNTDFHMFRKRWLHAGFEDERLLAVLIVDQRAAQRNLAMRRESDAGGGHPYGLQDHLLNRSRLLDEALASEKAVVPFASFSEWIGKVQAYPTPAQIEELRSLAVPRTLVSTLREE